MSWHACHWHRRAARGAAAVRRFQEVFWLSERHKGTSSEICTGYNGITDNNYDNINNSTTRSGRTRTSGAGADLERSDLGVRADVG
eukprot:SAG31_NODE_34120_length_336_cov_0.864979_2_plen_86_part_01